MGQNEEQTSFAACIFIDLVQIHLHLERKS